MALLGRRRLGWGLLLFSYTCTAQHYATQFFGNEQGIKSSVHNIMQHSDGAIWFGTQTNGLYRFDNRHLTNYSIQNGLVMNDIISLFEDKYGNVWTSNHNHGTSYITPQGKIVTVERTTDSKDAHQAFYDKITQEVQYLSVVNTTFPNMEYGIYNYEKNIFVKKEVNFFMT
jgi:ligand-binding sensor domain-containing protein